MRYLLCFMIGLSGLLFSPSDLAGQSTFNELTEVKALRFKDKKALKGYLMVPQFVSVDLRKGIVKPAKGISMRYSKKFNKIYLSGATKLSVKELNVIGVHSPGDLGNGASMRCYRCGCMPVTRASDGGPVMMCNGSCPCMSWIVIPPTKNPPVILGPDDDWRDWGNLP